MARPANVLSASSVLQCKRSLCNHLTGVRTHNVDTQYPVGLSIGEELHHTLGVEVRLGTAVGAEGKGADLVLHALLLEFGFVLADPGNFRVGVHDGWDGIIVDVAVVLGDEFDGCHGFLFGLVCKHGAEGAVADHADVWDLGAVFRIDDQTAAVVGLEADVLKAEILRVGTTANGDENDVCVELSIH